MNNEYQQIIDEAYNPYFNKAKEMTTVEVFSRALIGVGEIIEGMLQPFTRDFVPYTQEQFVNKCKTEEEFSRKWGLKIKEKELSLEERLNIWASLRDDRGYSEDILNDPEQTHMWLDTAGLDMGPIPRRIISLTYKGATTEVYE